MPSPASAKLLFALAAGVAVVGQLLVLRDGLAGRTPAASRDTAARVREGLWIVIPAIALALTIAATWRALPPGRGAVIPAKRSPVSLPPARGPVAD